MPFGDTLCDAIKAAGMTQLAFAQAVLSSSGNITDVIKGRRLPPLKHLEKWADVLGLSGANRDEFISAGQLEHTPELIRNQIISQNKENASNWERFLLSLKNDQLSLLSVQLRDEIRRTLGDPDRSHVSLAHVGKKVWSALGEHQADVLIPGATTQLSEDGTTYRATTQAGELAKVKAELAQARQDLAALAHLAAEVERLKSELARMQAAKLGKPPRRPAQTGVEDGFTHLDKELARHAAPITPSHPSAVPSAPQGPAV